jgi:hypothetical protein|nr:MAG TPA: hypothetical protein [Bacteriophage sp.]
MYYRWVLGEGMATDESILDSVTFDQLIYDLKCSCDHVTEADVIAQAKEILDQRVETYWDLVKSNAAKVAAMANKEEASHDDITLEE